MTLSEIVQQITSAIIWVHKNCKKYGGNPNKITISGHSAGAHLCSMAINIDWSKFNIPNDIIKGAVLISGIYEPEIVLNLSVNEEIKLSKKEALKNTPSTLNINVPHIITCVGGSETKGWIDQTKRYTKKIINYCNNIDYAILQNENHFSLIISLAEPENRFVKKMIYMAKNI